VILDISFGIHVRRTQVWEEVAGNGSPTVPSAVSRLILRLPKQHLDCIVYSISTQKASIKICLLRTANDNLPSIGLALRNTYIRKAIGPYLVRTLAILSDAFSVFPQTLQTITEIIPRLCHDSSFYISSNSSATISFDESRFLELRKITQK
jgi:hypothetical protein